MAKRRTPKTRTEITDEERDWLFGLESPWRFFSPPQEKVWLWQQFSGDVLAAWIANHPGIRPDRWWEYSAPEPRQRLGGTGTPSHEVLAYKPEFRLGIPCRWVDEWQRDYYNGRRRDIHGKPIGQEYQDGHFKGVPPDPNDPPTFESQAAYLRRLGLFLPGEERRLTAADFSVYKLRF